MLVCYRISDARNIFAISPTLRVGFFVISVRAFAIDTLIHLLSVARNMATAESFSPA
jgi:hypothetical protein